jgi:hypothetical protein
LSFDENYQMLCCCFLNYLREHIDGGARQSLRFGGQKRLELAQRSRDGADACAAPVGGRV